MVSEKLQGEFDAITADVAEIKALAVETKAGFVTLQEKIAELEKAISGQASEAEILAKLEEVKVSLEDAKSSVDAIDGVSTPV